MNWIKDLWRKVSPHYRRINQKRMLEEILRQHGLDRKTAKNATNHYFCNLRNNTHD